MDEYVSDSVPQIDSVQDPPIVVIQAPDPEPEPIELDAVWAVAGHFPDLPPTPAPSGTPRARAPWARAEPKPPRPPKARSQYGLRPDLPPGLITSISEKHGSSEQAVMAKARGSQATMAARAQCYLALIDLKWTYPQIGAAMGRHRTAVQWVVEHWQGKGAKA